MKPSPFDDLLGDDETILWLARARQQKGASVATAMFLLFGFIFIAMAIWMFVEGSGDFASTNSMGILAPGFALSAGLFGVWLGVTGKGMLPPPTYAISANQAFMAENKPGGGMRRSIFLISREYPATVTGFGNCCRVRIPVVRESRLGRTSVTFTCLTELESGALLRTLAQASEPS